MQYTDKRKIELFGTLAEKVCVQNLIDIYQDNWKYILEDELKRQFSPKTFSYLYLLKTIELNIVKRVVNELSLVYKKSPTRLIYIEKEVESNEGEETETKEYDEGYEYAVDQNKKNVMLKQCNKYTNLINHSLIQVSVENKQISHELINFNNCEVFTSKKDWRKVTAIKIYSGLELGMDSNQQSTNPYKWSDSSQTTVYSNRQTQSYATATLWVKEDMPNDRQIVNDDIKMLKGGMVYHLKCDTMTELIVSEEENPYRDEQGNVVLPFVIVDKTYPVGQRFNFSQGNDLFDLNINVGVMMVLLNQLVKQQSFKQLAVITPDVSKLPKPMYTDPNQVIALESQEGAETSIDVLDLQSNIQTFFDLIKSRIITVLSGYGVSPENFSMSASPSSGFALKISNTGKIESREDQIDMYRMMEKELFGIERIVWNQYCLSPDGAGMIPIDTKAEFMIDFAEIDFGQSTDEWIKEKGFLLSHNAISEIDLIKENNPDCDDEMAEAIYQKNKLINNRSTAAPITLAPLQNKTV